MRITEESGTIIIEKEITRDIEMKVYNKEFMKMIGFGDARIEILEECKKETTGGGKKDTFPYRQFAFLLTGKEETEEIQEKKEVETKEVNVSNTYEYFKSIVQSLTNWYPKTKTSQSSLNQPEEVSVENPEEKMSQSSLKQPK